MEYPSPLVIGGVGGSGTRVYRDIASIAGYRMLAVPWFRYPFSKSMRDRNHDNYMLRLFFYPFWTDPYRKGELSLPARKIMELHCRISLRMCGFRRTTKWGWKNPRAIYLLDFFQKLYPHLRFIHVVRDGRDHAFHPTFDYVTHQDFLLSIEETRLPDHKRKALSWIRTHELGERLAKECVPDQYLQTRLEDLCRDPLREVTRIHSFLGANDPQQLESASRLVNTPSSLGRWRKSPASHVAEVEQLIGKDLKRLGYVLSSDASNPMS